jgi:hypothetical protein
MAVTWTKLLALAIAIGYVVAASLTAPSVSMIVTVAVVVAGPVALIWFPEYLGGSWINRKKTVLFTYDEPGRPMNRPQRDSHPGIVAFMGWFFLVGLPPLVYWLARP